MQSAMFKNKQLSKMMTLWNTSRFNYHSIARDPIKAIGSEKSVLVYDSQEYKSFSGSQQGNSSWASAIMSNPHKSKFFSLIPFFIESRAVTKYFVLRMEFFPNAQYLKLHVLRLGGVYEHYLPLKQVIPITPYDYWCASWMVWFKQNQCIDLDMIYANYVTKEMYVFDK